MRRRTFAVGLFGLLASLVPPAIAQLDCPMGAVEIGDTQDEVAAKCGPPTTIQEWDQTRVAEADLPDGTFVEPLVVVPQPEWVYSFGPTRFVYFIRFENGVVTNIRGGDVMPAPAFERDIPNA